MTSCRLATITDQSNSVPRTLPTTLAINLNGSTGSKFDLANELGTNFSLGRYGQILSDRAP